MRSALILSVLAAAGCTLAAEVQTEYTLTHKCERQTQRGDSIAVHYRGTLADSGKQFDASYDRGQPLNFKVGSGQVIKGWDEGLLDMCPGDKRKLTIPPEFGYGDRSMGPIPAGSTLVFETELVEIKGVDAEERVVKSSETADAPEPETAHDDDKEEEKRDEL